MAGLHNLAYDDIAPTVMMLQHGHIGLALIEHLLDDDRALAGYPLFLRLGVVVNLSSYETLAVAHHPYLFVIQAIYSHTGREPFLRMGNQAFVSKVMAFIASVDVMGHLVAKILTGGGG